VDERHFVVELHVHGKMVGSSQTGSSSQVGAFGSSPQSGNFSSDRTIGQYAYEIWNVKPCVIQ